MLPLPRLRLLLPLLLLAQLTVTLPKLPKVGVKLVWIILKTRCTLPTRNTTKTVKPKSKLKSKPVKSKPRPPTKPKSKPLGQRSWPERKEGNRLLQLPVTHPPLLKPLLPLPPLLNPPALPVPLLKPLLPPPPVTLP